MTVSKSALLGAFAAKLREEDVPDDVLETARIALTHNLSVAAAGGRLNGVTQGWSAARCGGQGSRALVSGRSLGASDAAFVNACLIHARAQDDTYFPGLTHVGSATVPPVLALGEANGASLRSAILAIVAGYEVAAAVSRVAATVTTSHGFRGSGIYGVFGSAAASSRLLGLDRRESTHAIGIASSFAAGTNQTWVDGSLEWQLQLGAAARSGLEAAELASSGAVGSAGALEGSSGFFAAFARDASFAEQVADELGTVWATRDVSFKSHPVCAILQSPVETAAAVHRESSGQTFTRATLSLTPTEACYPGTDGLPPFDEPGGALMSAAHCVATALSRGSVTVGDLMETSDDLVIEAARRVEVVGDSDLSPREFILEVEWDDGRSKRASGNGDSSRWGRAELFENLDRLQAEVPDGIDLLRMADLVLDNPDTTVTDLVDTVIAS